MNGEFPLPSIFRLKDEHVEPEHEELVQLALSTGSTYQSPPQKPPLPPPPPPKSSPAHPSLLQLFTPSSSTRSPKPPSELSPLPHPSFSQLGSQSSSRSPEPQRFLVLPPYQPQWSQDGIFTLPPPPPTSTLHPSLFMPSFSSPPPGFHFSMPSSSSRQLPKENGLTLTSPELHFTTTSSSRPILPEQTTAPQPLADQSREGQAHRSGKRRKRNHKKEGWQPTIEPLYPWASSMRAQVLSMEELISKKITVITGDVKCKECNEKFQIGYDLKSKFCEVVSFIASEKGEMHDRAPDVWMKPEGLDCKFCGKSKCVEPVPPEKKKKTNWLFLFLGQMIGSLKLTHLKYFCEHTSSHRTAAKDRLLYLTYKNLHCQLDPKAEDLYNPPKEEDDL